MRDTGEPPNTARYARGGRPRRVAGQRPGQQPGQQTGQQTGQRAAGPGAPEPAEETSGGGPLSAASRRDLVADKFAGLGGMQLNWAQVGEYTLSTIQEALIDRQVPAENLAEPRLEVAVPALEAMRYSALRREFALLIASTMDVATADEAHPAFVEILKQLTLDEVNIIASLPAPGQALPMANLYHLDRAGHVRASLRRIIPGTLAARCSRQGAIPAYIDNMIRLSLIDTPARLKIDDERYYRDLLAQDFVTEHCARMPAVLRPSMERAVLTLTDLGNRLRRCCFEAPEPPPRIMRT